MAKRCNLCDVWIKYLFILITTLYIFHMSNHCLLTKKNLIIDKICSHLLKLDIKLKVQKKWSINYHMYYNSKKIQVCWNVDINHDAFARHFAKSCINMELWRIMCSIAHHSIISNQQITFEVKNIQLLLHQLNNNFMKP
jgi:hypothetical protein